VQLSSNLFYQISTLLFIFSLLAHAWLGLKSVFLDYIKPWRLRFLLQMVLTTVLLGIGVWALLVIGVK
jgi:succinate dehydrogenase / fumarate reductase membrane anchor subunit